MLIYLTIKAILGPRLQLQAIARDYLQKLPKVEANLEMEGSRHLNQCLEACNDVYRQANRTLGVVALLLGGVLLQAKLLVLFHSFYTPAAAILLLDYYLLNRWMTKAIDPLVDTFRATLRDRSASAIATCKYC